MLSQWQVCFAILLSFFNVKRSLSTSNVQKILLRFCEKKLREIDKNGHNGNQGKNECWCTHYVFLNIRKSILRFFEKMSQKLFLLFSRKKSFAKLTVKLVVFVDRKPLLCSLKGVLSIFVEDTDRFYICKRFVKSSEKVPQ